MKKIMFNDKYGLTKAVLEGRKTQTRRIGYQGTFKRYCNCGFCLEGADKNKLFINDGNEVVAKSKFKIGEEVAIAQRYIDLAEDDEFYRLCGIHGMPLELIKYEKGCDNKMFVKADLMPHRIRITYIRVELLQNICEEDCLAEGIVDFESKINKAHFYSITDESATYETAKKPYSLLIDKISGKGTWDRNPLVFVYEFELIKYQSHGGNKIQAPASRKRNAGHPGQHLDQRLEPIRSSNPVRGTRKKITFKHLTKQEIMGKNKKRNRWNSQPRKQENPLAQQQKMVAPKAVRDYWANNLTPDEQQIFNTPIAVAQQAGVMQRLGYLTAAFLHIHSVQSLLFGEMQNIVEDWGLLIKGVQPVINSLLNSEDKFFNVMHDLVKNQSTGIKETYTQDVDALFDRITRWEGIPKVWKPGDEQKLEGRARMDDIIGSLKQGVLKLKEQDMEPEPKEEARIFYAIAEMNEDETSTIIEQDIANKGMAAIKARNLAKKNPDKMYVLFEQRMQVQETCHMTPFKAVQKPADQDEVVNVKIEPMKKGKKPKE